jgi:hypothetical protein
MQRLLQAPLAGQARLQPLMRRLIQPMKTCVGPAGGIVAIATAATLFRRSTGSTMPHRAVTSTDLVSVVTGAEVLNAHDAKQHASALNKVGGIFLPVAGDF